MAATVFVRRCRTKITGEVLHLPVAAFASGAISNWVYEIGEPFKWEGQADAPDAPESAMRTGGQRNAMRPKATARG